MIVLDEEKLSMVFREIAKGFVKSPLEILLFIVLVLGIISFFITISRYQAKKSKIAKALRAQEVYNHITRKKAFNPLELDLLEKLSKHLNQFQEKYLLLESQSIFNACARKLQEAQRVPPSLIAGLRLKLGFKATDPEKIPHSSVELPDDQPVMITGKGGKSGIHGMVLKSQPHSLSIALEEGSAPPAAGSLVQVYFQNRSGLFAFNTIVRKTEKEMIQVAHSEKIRRLQRRNFYRKKTTLPVYVKLSGAHEQPVRSAFIDLGGGGASIINPNRRFEAGNRIDLSFTFPSGRARINLTAEVMRESENGKKLHVIFGPIPESSRDRIMHFLFKKKK